MINSGQLMSIKDACEATGIKYQTARAQIMQSKRKGNDFHKLIDEYVIEKLRNARPEIYKTLRERAINGSAKHIELFMKAVGDFKEKHETNINVGLQFVFGGSQMPDDLKEEYEKRQKVYKITDI